MDKEKMDLEKVSSEFDFIRDKIEKAASLLAKGEKSDLIECAFFLGSLQNICHFNACVIRKVIENKVG